METGLLKDESKIIYFKEDFPWFDLVLQKFKVTANQNVLAYIPVIVSMQPSKVSL